MLDKDDQTQSRDFQNSVNQSGCDQAAGIVSNWRLWEKKEPQAHCNCFHVPQMKKKTEVFVTLHLYDQMPSDVCF